MIERDTSEEKQVENLLVEDGQVFEVELDSAPEKVWRAVTIPAFRERWLPPRTLAEEAPISLVPGEEVRYRLRDEEPPHRLSTVTFEIRPGTEGGTLFRTVHQLDEQPSRRPAAANGNRPPRMLAA